MTIAVDLGRKATKQTKILEQEKTQTTVQLTMLHA